eukprot:15463694-Alexandrium_andersonii.AAC.1
MKHSGRNGVFLRVIQEHRVPEEEKGVEWISREAEEPVRQYHARVIGLAGERGVARRVGGGSCFGIVGAGPGGRGKALWR